MKLDTIGAAGLFALAGAFSHAQTPAAAPALEDVIVVSGHRLGDDATATAVTSNRALYRGGDATWLTARIPGGARVGNGAISGQMAYRGLFGERLNLRVDGQRFASGGPNLMDPVFHYAPEPLIAAVVIDRGVSPVSAGPGLGGGADARFKRIGFAANATPVIGADLSLGARSVDAGVSGGGVVGAATDRWRVNLLGAIEEADDLDYGDGTVAGSGYEREVYGVSAGVRFGAGELSLDLRRQHTGRSGNPPFPMDIVYFDTDFARLGYLVQLGDATLEFRVHGTSVDHLMDNFSQRPAPEPMRTRATFATAETRGAEVSVGFGVLSGEVRAGIDGELIEHDVTITNPNNAAFLVTPFPDVELSRTGAFVEWTGAMGLFEGEIGTRIDRHGWDAGAPELGAALPMGPTMLAAAFAASQREGDAVTVDAVARLWTPADDGVSWRFTFARKQRMPGYIQRFGWLPITASGGLADGNTYVGDLDLDPETAWIVEFGVDWMTSDAYVRPTLFMRWVNDFIQGTPFDATPGIIDSPVEMVSSMNGDPTPLRWANVDARLYGLDLDAGFDLPGPLRLDGTFSYVRGERSDIDDDLYRVTPPNLRLGLTWEADSWTSTLQVRAVAQQDRVSVTNDETAADGYAVLDLFGDWQVGERVSVAGGIENLFDRTYRDHLSGINRHAGGDVALGDRVPGAGRGVFVRLRYTQ